MSQPENNENNENNENSEPNESSGTIQWSDRPNVIQIWLTSDLFLKAGARAQFNQLSHEILTAHPEWYIVYVKGNHYEPSPNQHNPSPLNRNYIITIAFYNDYTLIRFWPEYVIAMNSRMAGLNLPSIDDILRDRAALGSNTRWKAPLGSNTSRRRGGRRHRRKSSKKRQSRRRIVRRKRTRKYH